MMEEKEEPPEGVVEAAAEVKELPIISINATIWDIDPLNVQIMKKPNTEAHIQCKVKKKA